MEFVKWPKVRQLHNVRKEIKARKRYHEVEGLDPYQPPEVQYRGKIKLDGTNAAVKAKHGDIHVQSRSRIITPGDDNLGFAKWAWESGFCQDLSNQTGTLDVTVFGEWCGKGIQKRCAISKIDRKIFAVFAVLYEGPLETKLLTDPVDIRKLVPLHDDVYILPWYDEISVDFASAEALETTIETLNKTVETVEKCDPWVDMVFNIQGLGEGVVYYPVHSEGREIGDTRSSLEGWGFKAKGEEHQVVRQKAPVILDPERVAGIDAFVSKFVTPQRLEQGLREIGGEADAKFTGNFLKWLGQDVKEESKDELDVSGLEWKDVSKGVMTAARKWWMEECRK